MNIYLNGLNNQLRKGLNVYSVIDIGENTTPTGSSKSQSFVIYKHLIPAGFFANHTQSTLKGSNIYRDHVSIDDTTPTGSINSLFSFFYNHQIPKGFFTNILPFSLKGSNVNNDNDNAISKNMTSKRSNVYRNHVGVDNTTHTGSHTPVSFIFYKHAIPSGLIIIENDNLI